MPPGIGYGPLATADPMQKRAKKMVDDKKKPQASPAGPQQQAPQAPAPTFMELQRAGRPRPAPPAMAAPTGPANAAPMPTPGALPAQGGAQQGGNNIGSALESLILGNVQNPSRYGSEQAGATFNRLNTLLGEQFDARRRGTNENLASRGLYDSTIAYGNLQDIDTQQGRAQTDLAARIAEQQATTEGSDISRAIANALGFGGQQFGQQLATAEFNTGQQQYLDQLMLQLMGLGQ